MNISRSTIELITKIHDKAEKYVSEISILKNDSMAREAERIDAARELETEIDILLDSLTFLWCGVSPLDYSLKLEDKSDNPCTLIFQSQGNDSPEIRKVVPRELFDILDARGGMYWIEDVRISLYELLQKAETAHSLQNTPEIDQSVKETTEDSEYCFLKEGDYWKIAYGDRPIFLKSSKGLYYIQQLLKNPKAEVSCLQLVQLESGSALDAAEVPRRKPHTEEDPNEDSDENASEVPSTGTKIEHHELSHTDGQSDDPALDTRFSASIRQSIERARKDLEAAKEAGQNDKAKTLQKNLEEMQEYLRKNTDHRGRSRKVTYDGEKARKAVSKCIKEAIQSTNEYSNSLAIHLLQAINTGRECSYTPEDPPPWVLD